MYRKDVDFEYSDNVVIKRSSGDTDEVGNEIFQIMYDGACIFELPSSSGTFLRGEHLQADSLVFIPVNDVEISINDVVVVTTEFGRTLEFTVKQYEPCSGSAPQMNDTCIWLKDGTDE